MINIIKTAIITIIISFISGLLLDYYKNRSPKILCKMKKGKSLKLYGRGICNYVLTIKNISNKTIHNINVTAQGIKNNLEVGDPKITRGLKFDASIENNELEVVIPFLSKNDEFSITLHVEEFNGEYTKPIIAIRSPEKFKRVNVDEGKTDLVPNLKKKDKKVSKRNKFRVSKRVIIAVATIVLAICLGVLEKGYFSGMNNAQDKNPNNTVKEQSFDENNKEDGNTKSVDKDTVKEKTSKKSQTPKSSTRTKSSNNAKPSINTKKSTEDKSYNKDESTTKQNTDEKEAEKKEAEEKINKDNSKQGSTTVTGENGDEKQEKSSKETTTNKDTTTKDETKSTSVDTENVNK